MKRRSKPGGKGKGSLPFSIQEFFGQSGFSLLVLTLLICLAGCRQKTEIWSGEEELEPEAFQAEEAEAPTKPAVPKMTEELYIDITARSALIWDKYKEEPEKAQQEVDNLYLKAGVTWKEYKEYEAKLTLKEKDTLQKKILEYMQKIITEYR
ncbi:MAG: hypothetical protein ACUVWQ_10410 [Candidatus Aminicenantales bacterium]